jgi:hypothetical protein
MHCAAVLGGHFQSSGEAAEEHVFRGVSSFRQDLSTYQIMAL